MENKDKKRQREVKKMMNRRICLDMDGTFVDFYGVQGWLEYLMNHDATPYKVAKPLYDVIELLEVLDRGALSAGLSPEQKARKVSNLLQKMKAEKQVEPRGPRNKAKWHLV